MRLLEVGRRGPHVQLHDLLARELLEPLTAAAAPPPREPAAQEGAADRDAAGRGGDATVCGVRRSQGGSGREGVGRADALQTA